MLTPEEIAAIEASPGLTALHRSMNRNVRRARNGFIILLVFVLIAAVFVVREQSQLCHESHHRYDTLAAVIVTSTTISPITKQRVTGPQYAQLAAYEAELRAHLFADLGAPPTC